MADEAKTKATTSKRGRKAMTDAEKKRREIYTRYFETSTKNLKDALAVLDKAYKKAVTDNEKAKIADRKFAIEQLLGK